MNIYILDGDVAVTRIKQKTVKNYMVEKDMTDGNVTIPEGTIMSYCEKIDIKREIFNMITQIKVRFNTDKIYVCFSDKVTFRHRININYKKRDVEDLKVFLNDLIRKEFMRIGEISEHFECKFKNDLEADDLMSILATWHNHVKNDSVTIGTIDKDLKTVAEINYHNMNNDQITYINSLDATRYFYLQLITGDKQDNIIGIKGYGNITGMQFVDKYLQGDLENEYKLAMMVKALYATNNIEESFLMNARLLNILNYKQYNKINGEIKLWEMPNVSECLLTY